MLKDSCKDLVVHDSYARQYQGVKLTNNLEGAICGRDCLVLVTRHKEYLELKPEDLQKK
jgi:UDP-N-acetyl-D-mannosaminuronate dehydrogenase